MTIAPRPGRLRSLPFVFSPVKGGNVVGFKAGERSIEHFPPRHDDDVETRGNSVPPEDLAREALGSVALDGRPKLPGGGNSQPGCDPTIRHHE